MLFVIAHFISTFTINDFKFQGFCQLYCYSKDSVMNSMNVPLNFHSDDSQVGQVEGLGPVA